MTSIGRNQIQYPTAITSSGENGTKRLSWPEYFVSLAVLAGARSADPYRKVGAFCISKDNRVLSCGYNGIAAGADYGSGIFAVRESEERKSLIIHAEQNALVGCKRGEVESIAITCSPCAVCANIIAAYGIKHVYFAYEYPREQAYRDIFKFYGIHSDRVEINGVFSPDMLELVKLPSIS